MKKYLLLAFLATANSGEDIVMQMVSTAGLHPTGNKAIVWDGEEKRTLNIFK